MRDADKAVQVLSPRPAQVGLGPAASMKKAGMAAQHGCRFSVGWLDAFVVLAVIFAQVHRDTVDTAGLARIRVGKNGRPGSVKTGILITSVYSFVFIRTG